MLKAEYKSHRLIFKQAGGTSRGVLHTKPSWYLRIWDVDNPSVEGWGECSIIPDLSIDDRPEIEDVLKDVCVNINTYVLNYHQTLELWPAVRFAVETALRDLSLGGKRFLFPSSFTQGADSIRINGLIWMGTSQQMKEQIKLKLELGFTCLKLKIGALSFSDELALLNVIRSEFSEAHLELRVDANGAFQVVDAQTKLDQLSVFGIHSIEQPIKAGQWEHMASLCRTSPIPIALDEELIGITGIETKEALLNAIPAQYLILKPSLLGGWQASDEWISLLENRTTQWWATSALEANIGLNAISQWVYDKKLSLPQGLGTGQVFTNNLACPLELIGESMYYNTTLAWDNPFILE